MEQTLDWIAATRKKEIEKVIEIYRVRRME